MHGANRLGTNSLLDLLVFGKRRRRAIIVELQLPSASAQATCRSDAGDATLARLARLDGADARRERRSEVGADMRRTMQLHCGVFRFPDSCSPKACSKMKEIAERAQRTAIKDKSRSFNTARVEALELDNLVETARATMVSAEARKESRGAHDRARLSRARRRELAEAHAVVSRKATGSSTSRST